MSKFFLFLKDNTLPCAIIFGTLCYLLFANIECLDDAGNWLSDFFDVLFPLCLFLTLFTTFARVDFHKMRLHWWHGCLLASQLALVGLMVGVVFTFDLSGSDKHVAEAFLVCLIAPCAVAAPVVSGKLGGDINTMTTFTLVSSLTSAITIPLIFPMMEHVEGLTFIGASTMILQKLAMVIVLPMLLGWLVRRFVEPVYRFILNHKNISYYLWACTLSITTGITVKNINHSGLGIGVLMVIGILSLFACLLHFGVGRLWGRHFNEIVNCGQGMFQKNTGLAIWVSYMYLHPVASIGAGFYVLWQNIINAWEIKKAQRDL